MFAPKRPTTAIALSVVLIAMLAATLAVVASAPTAQAADAEFVTTSTTPEGWLVFQEGGQQRKLWVSSACRAEIEGSGTPFTVRSWSEFGNLPDEPLGRTCLEIQSLAAGMLGQDEDPLWRLATVRDSFEGWLVRADANGQLTKQYLNPSCRQQVESAGNSFQELDWNEFGNLPASSAQLTCSEVVTLVGDNPGGPAPGEEPSTPVSGEGNGGPEVFSTASSSSGWLVRTSLGVRTKQWLDPACRAELEASGHTFAIAPWSTLDAIGSVDPTESLTCAAAGTALAESTVSAGVPSIPPPGPTPPSTPTVLAPASGQFTVVDGRVLDPSGQEFLLRGMNVWAEYFPYTGWDAGIIEDRDRYLNLWNVNAMRLNIICETECEGSFETHLENPWIELLGTASLEGEEGGYVIYQQGATKYRQWVNAECKQRFIESGIGTFPTVDWIATLRPLRKAVPNRPCAQHLPIDDIIAAYRGTGMVFLIDYHVVDFPNAPTVAEIESAKRYLVNLAEKYKDNPYVWFSPFNEPLNECDLNQYGARLVNDDGTPQTTSTKASATWYNMHVPIIDAIRATGNTNLIVANASNYGQDRCDANGPFSFQESSIMQYGQKLIDRDPVGRVIFDMHFYSRWSLSSINDINDYFNALNDRNLPVLLGEIGGKCHSQNIFKHDLNAAKKLLENWDQVENPPIGAFVWHAGMGFPLTNARGDDATRQGWENDPFPGVTPGSNAGASKLTPNGRLWWDWVHPEHQYFSSTPNCW